MPNLLSVQAAPGVVGACGVHAVPQAGKVTKVV
jgi:hypothetical protein